MLQAQRLRFEPKLMVDYLSAQGPRVSAVRGMLLHGALTQLKQGAYLEDYRARLPPAYRSCLLEALASTWVPVEALVAHFETLDSMLIDGASLGRLSEPAGTSVFTNLFAGLLRAARTVGADGGMWTLLKQSERVWSRIYSGGGCKVTQVGPKDAITEIIGLPYASSRSFRTMACGALRGVITMTAANVCAVKCLPSSDSRADRLSISMSWV